MMRCAQPKTGPALKVRGQEEKVCLKHYKGRFIVLFVTPLLFRTQLKTNLSSIQQENATSTPTSLLSLMQDRYLLPVETC